MCEEWSSVGRDGKEERRSRRLLRFFCFHQKSPVVSGSTLVASNGVSSSKIRSLFVAQPLKISS